MTAQFQSGPGSIVMEDVSWDYYSLTLEELEPTRGTRVIFDQGRLEIMTTSAKHERVKWAIARLLATYALEVDIPMTGLGQLTLRQKQLKVGLEPDECYYVQTPPPPPVEGEVDLSVYGPPDLAIEVEISKGVIPKLPIYRALKIFEIWRYTDAGVIPHQRSSSGDYKPSAKSRAFPDLDMMQFSRFVNDALTDEHSAVKALQEWARGSMKKRS